MDPSDSTTSLSVLKEMKPICNYQSWMSRNCGHYNQILRKLMHNQMKKPYETRDLVYLIQAEPIWRDSRSSILFTNGQIPVIHFNPDYSTDYLIYPTISLIHDA
jgi:hypothetical protein